MHTFINNIILLELDLKEKNRYSCVGVFKKNYNNKKHNIRITKIIHTLLESGRFNDNIKIIKIIILNLYTIIFLKYVCLSMLANCRSQFLLDRLGRCLKLFVSTDSPSCHEFVSQFGLAIFLNAKNSRKPCRPCECSFE